ncbi:hypothetical protein ACWC5I_33175 [Kitasatospora sp. NPDC001574]
MLARAGITLDSVVLIRRRDTHGGGQVAVRASGTAPAQTTAALVAAHRPNPSAGPALRLCLARTQTSAPTTHQVVNRVSGAKGRCSACRSSHARTGSAR